MLRTSLLLMMILSWIHADGPLFKTGQQKCFSFDDVNFIGTVINCQGTGQDGEYQLGTAPVLSSANGVVTDDASALQWQDFYSNGVPQLDWYGANNYCATLTIDGGGWRLPTVRELKTILFLGSVTPIIDTNVFLNTIDDTFWTVDAAAVSPSEYAWTIDFGYGSIRTNHKSYSHYIRCVRSN